MSAAYVFGFATAFVPTDATPSLRRTQSKAITKRTATGACYRVEMQQAAQACPESSKWMAQWLHESNLQAYQKDTCLSDPKQRRDRNLLPNWCAGDDVKLWDPVQRRPVSSYMIQQAFASK
mmetsp:Transcript_808/g.2216  ORF Transcript_808/g.2216 Transcript_808/m.2216 type:complete len:121 (+) Transcript_808:193-555(+)